MVKITGDKVCFDKMCQQTETCLENRSLAASIKLLDGVLEYSNQTHYKSELTSVQETYTWMIKYMAEGISDPEREKIYNLQLKRVYALFDEVRKQFYRQFSSSTYYEQMRTVVLDVPGALRLCASNHDVFALTEDSVTDLPRNVFNTFLVASLDDELCDSVTHYLESEGKNNVWGALIVTALSLNLLEVFDEKKFLLLVRIGKASILSETLKVRALVGLFFALVRYERRLSLYPMVVKAINMLDKEVYSVLHVLQLQLLLTQETKSIAHKMNQEIFPEMIRHSTFWRSRTLRTEDSNEDYDHNPLWEKDDTFRKMEKKLRAISEMQQKGADVYWATFSTLKQRFPFYRTMSNWFLPFRFSHPLVSGLHLQEDQMEKFLKTPFLCDSDKYSFCLMLTELPEQQRNIVSQQLSGRVEDVAEKTDYSVETEVRHYLQDLYRFYTLSPHARQLYNPFENDLLLVNNKWLNAILMKRDHLLEIAEFAFSQHNLKTATYYYDQLSKSGMDLSITALQKWGYCLQMMGMYREAADCYEKSLKLDAGDWSSEHLAQCYLRLGDFSRAVIIYHKLNAQENVRLHNLFMESHCLMQADRLKEALDVLYRALYLSVSDDDVDQSRRAIAWCLFLTGDLEQAELYYRKIKGLLPNDYLNLAHVLWAQGNEHDALNAYVQSIQLDNAKNIAPAFFDEDKKYLQRYGITVESMAMMIDAVNYVLNNNIR